MAVPIIVFLLLVAVVIALVILVFLVLKKRNEKEGIGFALMFTDVMHLHDS